MRGCPTEMVHRDLAVRRQILGCDVGGRIQAIPITIAGISRTFTRAGCYMLQFRCTIASEYMIFPHSFLGISFISSHPLFSYKFLVNNFYGQVTLVDRVTCPHISVKRLLFVMNFLTFMDDDSLDMSGYGSSYGRLHLTDH